MASTLCRTGGGFIRRTVLMSSVRAGSGSVYPPFDHHKGKVASDKITMPDTLGHAVGPERWELLAKLAGNKDPFEMEVQKRSAGTFEDPNIVTSVYEKRLVGCVCDEDSLTIRWMNVMSGEPTRCECGYWYKLKKVTMPDYS